MKTVGVILLVCLFQAVAGSVPVPDDNSTLDVQREGLLISLLRILNSLLFDTQDSNQNTPGNDTGGACTITNGSGENITIPGDVTITGDTNCIFDTTGTVSVGGDVTISNSDCTVSGQAIISVAGSVTITSSNITVIEGSVLCIHVGGDATATSVIFDTQNGSQTEVNIDGALTLTTTMCSGSTSTYDVNYGGFLTSTGSSTCVV